MERINAESMNEIIRKQILTIRKSGITNMFDVSKVAEISDDLGFVGLTEYLENNRRQYVQFILSGKVTND